MSRDVEQRITGWPASCLTLPIHRYMDGAAEGERNIPVSADAQARMDADRLVNHIRGRLLKIQAAANDYKWGNK
jgi:hypothetical protein